MIIPPYNGFGNEQDSLSNCVRLVPKQPKKDYFKYIDNDKITLRFLARLNTKIPEDLDRRFLISFFLADDSIQVYEMPDRNSGKFYFNSFRYLGRKVPRKSQLQKRGE